MKFKSLIFTLLLFTLAALPLRAQEGVELELEFVEVLLLLQLHL